MNVERTGEAGPRCGVSEFILRYERVLLVGPLGPLGARAHILWRVALAVAFASVPASATYELDFNKYILLNFTC